MPIRYGYEMSIECASPTAFVCQLDVHPSHLAARRAESPFATEPKVELRLYSDVFGNGCRRFTAPAGPFTFSNAGVVETPDAPDPVAYDAEEVPVPLLPDETLVYLVGSRYVETDKLSQAAWDLFGATPPGWARVQAICDFVHGTSDLRLSVRALDPHRVRGLQRTASASAAISRISPSPSAAA